ncbi:MAG TPA: SpoIID/LytB domain-containing protein [Solirubrobacterales bacterium]|jgi:stage II sporulation protein D|nr:SpoIID/LytB domain-containing protein [Solirubrobacterales bacterium]
MSLLRRHPLTLTLALLAALACACGALAANARAQVNWVVHGHGFGHGVGMSAYGAYGYALHGKGYKFILGHYYTGTSLGTISGPNVVRVLLSTSSRDVDFSEATSACRTKLEPTRTYEAHRVGNTVVLRTSAGKPLARCGATLRAAGAGVINIAGLGRYRGALETVVNESGELNVVNALAVDQYVKGVIPNESPPSWPLAELKAQAVASRSFALTAGVGGDGYDLYADTRSQVYKGLESEYTTSDQAEEETAGQVLMYEGQIAETLFSACSGGKTESMQNVFGTAVPYLVGVPDPYDSLCPLHEWTLNFSGPELSAKLSSLLDGRLAKVVITKTGYSPRIIEAKLYGTGGVTTVTGQQLEEALGAYSDWMTFEKVVES